jgi:hypothetical protein
MVGLIDGMGSSSRVLTGFLACMAALARMIAIRVSGECDTCAGGDDGGEEDMGSASRTGDLGLEWARSLENGTAA